MGVTNTWVAGGARDRNPGATWADGLANAFVRLDFERVSNDPFHGVIDQAETGEATISKVTAAAHRVHRRLEHVRRASGEVVFVNLQLSAVGETSQGGRTFRTAPFDIALADASRPYEIAHKDRFSLFSVGLPAAKVPPALLSHGGICLSRTAWGREIAKLMATQAGLALDIRLAPQARDVFARHFVDLLAIAACLYDGDPSRGAARACKAELFEDYARQNFRNPNLNAASAARAFGVSERSVQKAFAARETTFSEFVNALRLQDCARALGPFDRSGGSVSAIAYDAGFSDLSYFNRLFKTRFGQTPRDYRRRIARDEAETPEG
jgi:AraC-like DNA-binding protein